MGIIVLLTSSLRCPFWSVSLHLIHYTTGAAIQVRHFESVCVTVLLKCNDMHFKASNIYHFHLHLRQKNGVLIISKLFYAKFFNK